MSPRRRKPRPPEVNEDPSDGSLDTGPAIDFSEGGVEAQEFADRLLGIESTGPLYTYIYRMKPKIPGQPGTSREQWHVQTYHGGIPTNDYIGSNFGPGEYYLKCFYSDRSGKRCNTSVKVNIDPGFQRFDQPMYPAPAPGMNGHAMPAQPSITGQDLINLFGMFTQQMVTMMSMSNKPNPTFDQFQKSMSNMVLNNAKDQTRLISMLTAKQYDIQDSTEGEEEEVDVFGILKWAWENFGKKILAAPKSQQEMFRKQAAGLPQFQQILDRKEEYAAAYSELCNEHGKDSIDQVISVLGIPRPDEMDDGGSE